jgi:hypothetical protein
LQIPSGYFQERILSHKINVYLLIEKGGYFFFSGRPTCHSICQFLEGLYLSISLSNGTSERVDDVRKEADGKTFFQQNPL